MLCIIQVDARQEDEFNSYSLILTLDYGRFLIITFRRALKQKYYAELSSIGLAMRVKSDRLS